jgi:hypothetical protein
MPNARQRRLVDEPADNFLHRHGSRDVGRLRISSKPSRGSSAGRGFTPCPRTLRPCFIAVSRHENKPY